MLNLHSNDTALQKLITLSHQVTYDAGKQKIGLNWFVQNWGWVIFIFMVAPPADTVVFLQWTRNKNAVVLFAILCKTWMKQGEVSLKTWPIIWKQLRWKSEIRWPILMPTFMCCTANITITAPMPGWKPWQMPVSVCSWYSNMAWDRYCCGRNVSLKGIKIWDEMEDLKLDFFAKSNWWFFTMELREWIWKNKDTFAAVVNSWYG